MKYSGRRNYRDKTVVEVETTVIKKTEKKKERKILQAIKNFFKS